MVKKIKKSLTWFFLSIDLKATGMTLNFTPILANLMWPGLFVESGLISVWAVILGLLIEWPFVRWVSAAGWIRSLGMTTVINAVSFVIGYFINPIVGFFVIIPHDLLAMLIKRSGTFGPSGWIFTYHGIVLATAFVEFMAFRFFYSEKYYQKRQLNWPSTRKAWLGIWLANLASVAIAFFFIKEGQW
jgi:hypothetical protein